MTATEVLREEMKQYIDQADHESLRMVKKAILVIEHKANPEEDEEDWWDEMPHEIKALIEMSLKESEQGGGISHEEMLEKYSKWFRR